MDIRIHPATPDDIDAVARLFDAYRQFYDQPSDPAAARAFLRERMERRQSMILLAIAEGRAAGFAQMYPMFSSVRLAPIWVLNDLYVDSPMRRRGLARRLLDAAAAMARAAGAARIMLETGRENLAARALYASAGWEEEGTQWYAQDLLRPHGTG